MSQSQQEIFVKMVLDSWNQYIKRTDELFNQLSDEQLEKEIAPGRNRGLYLLGHLASVHDKMLVLLGFDKDGLYPGLYDPFVTSADRTKTDLPSIAGLRKAWKEIHDKLASHLSEVTTDDWFTRHNAVSEEDFTKEPHRNKLNLIINRTAHLATHYGQLIYLRKGKEE